MRDIATIVIMLAACITLGLHLMPGLPRAAHLAAAAAPMAACSLLIWRVEVPMSRDLDFALGLGLSVLCVVLALALIRRRMPPAGDSSV